MTKIYLFKNVNKRDLELKALKFQKENTEEVGSLERFEFQKPLV